MLLQVINSQPVTDANQASLVASLQAWLNAGTKRTETSPGSRQYAHAALYFQRCYQWNPKTSFDARIRAARLYERYLNERNKAIEIYKEVLGHETDAARIEEAQRRLTALSGGR